MVKPFVLTIFFLIPFPRTGKRSLALGAGDKSGLTPSKEENQIYVYENDDEEDPEFYETEADVMDGEDDDDLTMDEDYEDSLGRACDLCSIVHIPPTTTILEELLMCKL